jgi:hypothetical protein
MLDKRPLLNDAGLVPYVNVTDGVETAVVPDVV